MYQSGDMPLLVGFLDLARDTRGHGDRDRDRDRHRPGS